MEEKKKKFVGDGGRVMDSTCQIGRGCKGNVINLDENYTF